MYATFQTQKRNERKRKEYGRPVTKKRSLLLRTRPFFNRGHRLVRARNLLIRFQLFKICTVLIKRHPPSSLPFSPFFFKIFLNRSMILRRGMRRAVQARGVKIHWDLPKRVLKIVKFFFFPDHKEKRHGRTAFLADRAYIRACVRVMYLDRGEVHDAHAFVIEKRRSCAGSITYRLF